MKYNSNNDSVSRFPITSRLNQIFLGVLVVAIIAGGFTGYVLAAADNQGTVTPFTNTEKPKSATQDTRTFRDFAEGQITKKPAPKKATEYTEGTHLLVRDGQVPVALTSSVVDLSQFEGKKVKVFGETQKAVKEGWLMDVGKVEEIK